MSLSNSKGRADIKNSGYFRVFAEDDEDDVAVKLAHIISKVQACVISNGCVLDGHIIPSPEYNKNNVQKKCTSSTVSWDNMNGHYSKFKILRKDCDLITGKDAIEIDYLVVNDDTVIIYEIKDGDNFDTKKSKGEYDCLLTLQSYFMSKFPMKKVDIHIVMWNTKDL